MTTCSVSACLPSSPPRLPFSCSVMRRLQLLRDARADNGQVREPTPPSVRLPASQRVSAGPYRPFVVSAAIRDVNPAKDKETQVSIF